MRRRVRRIKQVLAALSAAALLMTSLVQNNAYVYAVNQPEEQSQTEETSVEEPTVEEQSVEGSSVEGSSVEQPSVEEPSAEESSVEEPTVKEPSVEESPVEEPSTEEPSAEESSAETEENVESAEAEETKETSGREETEEKTDAPDEDSEGTAPEGETEERKTLYSDGTGSQEQTVKAELVGAYQFGDAPSEQGGVSAFSLESAAETDTAELEDFLYRQMKERKETIDVQKYGIGADEIGSIVTGVLNENPDLYFVGKAFEISYDMANKVISVSMTYSSPSNDNLFRRAVKDALSVVKPEMSDLEKAIVLHDYLAINCEYDKENYDQNTIPAESYTAYGTLVERIAVCQGYALAYKYLLNQAGIDCLMVTSEEMNHTWNLVKLDGKYYQADVTWDDPVWDRIGRVEHEYMFRSDDAFRNGCTQKHDNWSVTEGSKVVDYKATDTGYDEAFWLGSGSPLVLVGKDCYYVTCVNDSPEIYRIKLSDITGTGKLILDIGNFDAWGGLPRVNSGLFYLNDRLYFNDAAMIYSVGFADNGYAEGGRDEFEVNIKENYLCGMAFWQGEVLYSLHKDPDEEGRETVLMADSMMKKDGAPDKTVKKIELDQETLKLAVGATTALHADVTPHHVDIEIIWESSDDTVAKVSDGTITAAAAGTCTITASADGETASCKVTVTAEEGMIAGGSYGNVTWEIDAAGKLTVEGSGEFTGSLGSDRTPWYVNRGSITSAEIQVTDMRNASAMFYGCENLTSVDLSGFHTFTVKNTDSMFYNCVNIESLDLSDLSLANLERGTDMFYGCSKLTIIDTPCHLYQYIELPAGTEDIWYTLKGKTIPWLPMAYDYSIKMSRNSVPTTDAAHIKVQKSKKVYECGEILNTDDLTVYYYDEDGEVKEVADYTTNAGEIDMSVPGKKNLTVDYNGLAASVQLTVKAPVQETCAVTFNLQGHGTALEEYSAYTEITKGSTIKRPASPEAEGYEFTGWYKEADCRTLWDFEKDIVEENTTLYAGWKSSDKPDDKPGENPGDKPDENPDDKPGDKPDENPDDKPGDKPGENPDDKPNENPDDKPNEAQDERPAINGVLFPGKKSEYSAVYTGEQIRPVMVVTYQYTDAGGRVKTEKLKLNVDYTVCYSNNVNAGENKAQVTVRGIGGYTGVITREFTIARKDIKNVALSAVGDIEFGGQPSVRVTDGTKELVEGRDYNINLSTEGSADTDTQSELRVEGIGNYTGTSKKSAKFNILRKEPEISSIASENIRVEFKNPAKKYTYNGKAQKPGVVVTDTKTGKKLSSGMYKVVYSNNVNAGTGMAWVVGVSKNGKGYYGESEPLYFDIGQKDFKKVSASLSGTIPKTGSIENLKDNIAEALVVKDAKYVFTADEYTVDYGDLKTIDTIKTGKKYTITLMPKAGGNYIENSQKKVNIKFGQLNLASKTANMSVILKKTSQNVEFRYNGILLEKDKDYTATIKPEKNKETYKVIIKAVKNSAYKGSKTFKNIQISQDTTGSDPGKPDDPGSDPTPEDPGKDPTPEDPGKDPAPDDPGSDPIPTTPGAKPAMSYNKEMQNYYGNFAYPIQSYLYENPSGGLTRVEYINGEIVAEDYDDSFHLCASRRIPMELPLWGGFYAGDQYNFVIVGQENPSEDDNVEVVRVVKYSKDWRRLGDAGLFGANTVYPFHAGSLRCAEYGDYLYIHTCHEMYAASDGVVHEANLMFEVRQSDMEITDSRYTVRNTGVGYVSHSFNQFVLVDQDQRLVTLDHGDAYPRSIVLMRALDAKAGSDKFTGKFESSHLLKFPGEIGENLTCAEIGGFVETKNGYITAFNYNGTGTGSRSDPRAVYLGYTSKSGLTSSITQITEYGAIHNPVLAPTGLDGGYLMWTNSRGEFYYTEYADGGTTGKVSKAYARLSDCQPILYNGECVWYVTLNSVPTFYMLDVSSGKISKAVAQ